MRKAMFTQFENDTYATIKFSLPQHGLYAVSSGGNKSRTTKSGNTNHERPANS